VTARRRNLPTKKQQEKRQLPTYALILHHVKGISISDHCAEATVLLHTGQDAARGDVESLSFAIGGKG
jgi:hypothetical protein